MPIPSGYEGFTALGDALMGGANARAQMNEDTMRTKAYGAAEAMWQARQRRAQAMIDESRMSARGGLSPEALTTAGYDPKMAPVLSAVQLAAETPDLRRLGDYENPATVEIDRQRQDALAKDDAKTYNKLTALRQDHDWQPVRVAGGAYIADGTNLGDLDAVPTPETAEQITAIQARTKQGQERADAAVRKADRPPAPRTSSAAPHHETAAAAEADVLAKARAAIGNGADKEAVKQRLKDKGYSKVADRL